VKLAPVVGPDLRGRLSDGALVEGSIRARLLGIPLLRLDAKLVLVPAGVTVRPPARHVLPAHTPTRPSVMQPRRSDPPGRSLAEAVRTIDEGAELLAEVRRQGS
jgi:hypothetical protein